MPQKPNVKLATFAIQNDGEPFLFKVNPETQALGENVNPAQEQQIEVDGEGNMNIAFGDEPTLIIGSSPDQLFEDGFWINDKDSLTFSPIFDAKSGEVVPKGFFGIRVLPGVTKFHIVTIVKAEEDEEDLENGEHLEHDEQEDEELTQEEINELNDVFEAMQQEDEQNGELFYQPVDEIAEFSPAPDEQSLTAEPKQVDPFKDIKGAQDIKPLMNFVDFIIGKEQENFIDKGARGATPNARDPHFLLSLPGMAFVTGRYNYARTMLVEIAKQIEQTMKIEQSPIAAKKAESRTTLNAFETELWFASVVNSFIEYCGDYDFVKAKLWNVLKQITDSIALQNAYQLSINENALLELAIADKKHVRAHLNALWYNHLRIMEKFGEEFHEETSQMSRYSQLARKLKREFNARLWDEKNHGVMDVDGDKVMNEVRPEHTFVISLEYSVLTQEKEKQLLSRIWKELYTPYGLKSAGTFKVRSLDGVQKSDRATDKFGFANDQSWAAFVGPFITSYVKIQHHTKKSKDFAKRCLFAPLVENMNMLSVEELALAQESVPSDTIEKSRQLIWNISELMRSYMEDIEEQKRVKH